MCRTYITILPASNSTYKIRAQTHFTTTEHYNDSFIFEATSDPVSLLVSSKLSNFLHLYIIRIIKVVTPTCMEAIMDLTVSHVQ